MTEEAKSPMMAEMAVAGIGESVGSHHGCCGGAFPVWKRDVGGNRYDFVSS